MFVTSVWCEQSTLLRLRQRLSRSPQTVRMREAAPLGVEPLDSVDLAVLEAERDRIQHVLLVREPVHAAHVQHQLVVHEDPRIVVPDELPPQA